MGLEERFLRQMDLCPPEKLAFPITVIGAGAIGSYAVCALAKMGCSKIEVWDHDILQEHNISNQCCRQDTMGMAKVDALQQLVEELAGLTISTKNQRYRGQRLEGLVVSAVDSMDARQEIWKRVRFNAAVPLLVDPRMGAEFARIYAIRPTDPDQVDFYEANLHSSKEAEPLPCGGRSIIYCPMIAGAFVALLVKKYAMGQAAPKEILFDLSGLCLLTS